MKCPFQTISITENVKAYAIGNNDFTRTTVSFQECIKDECPFYMPEQKWKDFTVSATCGRTITNETIKEWFQELKKEVQA